MHLHGVRGYLATGNPVNGTVTYGGLTCKPQVAAMAGINAYTSSLRNDRSTEKAYEEGVPFFVPQLSKVKTSVTCQGKSQTLLFSHEVPSVSSNPLSPLPYRKQGNRTLYSEENLLKRQQLLDNPKVLAAIARFWETFPCVRRGGETISEHDYVDVFVKFYKALVSPSEFSIPEARRIVEKDWTRDCIDGESMSKVLFFGSLFEVADIWTVDIGAAIYVSFLHKLFDRVTMTIFDHVKLQWITAFAELDRIRSFEDPNPPPEDVDNQTHEVTKKPAALGTVVEAPRPPLIRKKTRSSGGLLPSSEPSISEQRLPELLSSEATRPKPFSSRLEGNSEDIGNRSQEDEGHYHLIRRSQSMRSPPKSKLEMALEARRLRADEDGHKESARTRFPRLGLPELSPQPILLAVPNIYLDPDLTHAHDAERAARRRLRNSLKLAQRLRRITF
ncbi:hypothetical protein BBJ28_00007423 [Nothophytophthora sp. Chile5]|nr:hypothetical protein BBJ28_00007423 [Nothophytophthora sp. Chile5]